MPATDPITELLAGRYRDPETGDLLATECAAIEIADSLAGRELELVRAQGAFEKVAVIADADTQAALGARVHAALAQGLATQSIVLPTQPHADTDTVARLNMLVASGVDAIVSVGSGTVTDLSKMVALARDVPLFAFPTAPSMNGYASLSASITMAGVKRSVRARTPRALFFDLAVIAAAPARLIRAGLGDSLCRPTAQADWLLAHLLLDRPYREVPFVLLADDERELFARAGVLVARDLVAMRHLVRTLVLSGLGMTLAGGSYPASQGEHLVSHYLEASWPAGVPRPLHGEQVGVCTLAVAALQTRILARATPPALAPSTVTEAALAHRFGAERGAAYWAELRHKQLDPVRTDAANARLARDWDAIRARIDRVRIATDALAGVLVAAGAATTPEAIGCSRGLFEEAMRDARLQRDRYTFLDLAADAGLV
ncbi:MAG TPA: iron-containing alcohol dehydrogenase [Kofleriaceae bacterium]|nr:iron-containing alcohol dehydrogenase [Kofleriaceae bacterium]